MATEVQKVATGVLTNSILVRLYGFGILHGQVGANHGTQKLKVFQRVQERHAELRKILNNKEAWSFLCCSQKVSNLNDIVLLKSQSQRSILWSWSVR